MVLTPGFQLLGLSAMTAFEIVNTMEKTQHYELHFISEHGGDVVSSAGLSVGTQAFARRYFDTMIVPGAMTIEPASARLRAYLRAAAKVARRVTATCTGAFLLADAGLLDGRRATTHWAYARELQRMYPASKVKEDRIFIVDDNVWTSAGMAAGLDLALALIEKDMGTEISKAVAKRLVVYHRRGGGQSQFSALLELAPKSDSVQLALLHARSHLRDTLSVKELARAASLSPRQFSRVFRAETGQSPAKAVESLRLEAARAMMAEGGHSIETVVQESGFADRERMRRAFLRAFGQPPQVLWRQAHASRAAG
jgi:transcriptional regulator GlxA family with amidase domain